MSTQYLFRIIIAFAIALPVLFSGTSAANAQKTLSRQSIIQGLQFQEQQQGKKKSKRLKRGKRRAKAIQGTSNSRKRVAKKRAPSAKRQVAIRRAPAAKKRVAVRRSPAQSGNVQFRAPKSRNQKKLRSRAPTRVAKRRAPAKNNQQIRVRKRAPVALQNRAPTRVVRRRAPAPANNNQGIRAPKRAPVVIQNRAPTKVVKRRAPAPATNNQRIRTPKRAPVALQNRAPTRVVRRRAPASNHQELRAPVVVTQDPARNPQHFNNQVASTSEEFGERGIRIDEYTTSYVDAGSVDLEILFDYNSAKIKPKSVHQLIILGEALQDAALAGSNIVIAGHTDAAGGNGYNIDLSFRRAQSVTDFLINFAGIDAGRLTIEGHGEESLKYPDAPHSGQNRRVEIINLGSQG